MEQSRKGRAMRVIFNEEMKAVADDLDRMAQDVRKAINGAGDALMNADIDKAQAVIDGDIDGFINAFLKAKSLGEI